MTTTNTDTLLPVLRQDLRIVPGPDRHDGSPTWTIYDPVTQTYDQADWIQAQLLAVLDRPRTLGQVQLALKQTANLQLEDQQILGFCRHLVQQRLAQPPQGWHLTPPPTPRRTSARKILAAMGIQYLYLRIPLIRPQTMLQATVQWVRPLAGKPFLLTSLLVGLVGLIIAGEHTDRYAAMLIQSLSWQGLLWYLPCYVLIRLIHELAHAYTAVACGARVRSMGIALMLLYPIPYTDVTDTWQLADRTDRNRVSAAGVVAELIIAAWAMGLLAILPNTAGQHVALIVATVSLGSTLLVNLNPALKFDGYYLLADLLGIDNLQQRSAELLRWVLRYELLNDPQPDPEPTLSGAMKCVLIIYSCYAWAYRLLLYLGIAAVIYARFFKTLGLILIVSQLGLFIVMPMAQELGEMIRRRSQLRPTLIGWCLLGLPAALLVWAGAPLPRRHQIPAITRPQIQQTVYTPAAGTLRWPTTAPRPGTRVRAGQTLFEIQAPLDRYQYQWLQARVDENQQLLDQARQDPQLRAQLPEIENQLANLQAQTGQLKAQLDRQRVRAAYPGQWLDPPQALTNNTPVPNAMALGRIVPEQPPTVTGYVPESLVGTIQKKQRIWFYPDNHRSPIPGRLLQFDPTPVHTIDSPALTDRHHGPIPVDANQHALVPRTTWYRITVQLDRPTDLRHWGMTGQLQWTGPNESYLLQAWRQLGNLLIRQSQF